MNCTKYKFVLKTKFFLIEISENVVLLAMINTNYLLSVVYQTFSLLNKLFMCLPHFCLV